MRQVREIVRLGYAGVSKHQIALRTGVVPSTVRETLKRFAAAGLTWPLGDEVISLVGDHAACSLPLQQVICSDTVVGFTASEDETQWSALGVGEGMDFRG